MEEINLYKLLKFYVSYWRVLIGFAIAGLIAGYLYNTYIQVPSYKSSATLYVVSADQITTTTGSTLINNYVALVTSRRVLDPVIKQLNLHTDYTKLAGSVKASNQKDTAIITVTVSEANPTSSRNITNATTKSFIKQVKSIYGTDNIQVVDSADVATTPYNVRKNLQLVVAAIAGLLIPIVLIFFVYDYKLSNGTLDTKKNQRKSRGLVRKSVHAVLKTIGTVIRSVFKKVVQSFSSVGSSVKGIKVPKRAVRKPVKSSSSKSKSTAQKTKSRTKNSTSSRKKSSVSKK